MVLATKAAQLVNRIKLQDQPSSDFDGVAVMLLPQDEDQNRIAQYAGVQQDALHCTLVFLGPDSKVLDRAGYSAETLVGALRNLAADTEPFEATLGGLTRFSAGDNDPIVLNVDSKKVNALRKQVLTALRMQGLDEATEHGYTPHLTLGYVKKGQRLPFERWDAEKIIFDRIRIGYGGTDIDIPLGEGWDEKSVVRHVRTQEGADKYGQPIGAVIHADPVSMKLDAIIKRTPNVKDTPSSPLSTDAVSKDKQYRAKVLEAGRKLDPKKLVDLKAVLAKAPTTHQELAAVMFLIVDLHGKWVGDDPDYAATTFWATVLPWMQWMLMTLSHLNLLVKSDDIEGKAGVRHVRTREGSAFYGLPIGAVIGSPQLELDLGLPDPFAGATAQDRARLTRKIPIRDEYHRLVNIKRQYESMDVDYSGDNWREQNEALRKFGETSGIGYIDDTGASLANHVAGDGNWVQWGGCRAIRKAAWELLGFNTTDNADSRSDPSLHRAGQSIAGDGDPTMQAMVLLDGIHDAEPESRTFYRGVQVRDPDEFVSKLKEGDTFDMPLASFTDYREHSVRYGDDVTFVLQRGSKGVIGGSMGPLPGTDENSPEYWDWENDPESMIEYVSGGRFKIMRVYTSGSHDMGDPRKRRATVVIRQVGTFDPRSGMLKKDGHVYEVPWFDFAFDFPLAQPKKKDDVNSEQKDVYGGMDGLRPSVQHDKPVQRQKRFKLKDRAVTLCPNETHHRDIKSWALELEAKVAIDGDGDGFIYDGKPGMRPAPVGTPVLGDLTYGGKSPYPDFHTVIDGHDHTYEVGPDPEDDGFVAFGTDGVWDDIAVQEAKTKHECLVLLDARTRQDRPEGAKPVYGSLSENPTKINIPKASSARDNSGKIVKRVVPKKVTETVRKPSAAQRAKATAEAAAPAAAAKKAKKATVRKATEKRVAKKRGRQPGEFGRDGQSFEVAGQNEDATLTGTPRAGARKTVSGDKSHRTLVEVMPGSKSERYLRQKYGIPPAYKNIWFNTSRDESASDDQYDGLLYSAMDPKTNKRQSVYTSRWRKLKNGVKENNVGILAQNFKKVTDAMHKDAKGRDPKRKAAAQALLVQAMTGLRIGDPANSREGSYGASTLEARHVTVNATSVRFQFDGKGRQKVLDENGNPVLGADGKPTWRKGSPYDVTVRDKNLVELIKSAKEGKRGSDRLFPDADHNAYLKALLKEQGIEGTVTTHNFRHHFATTTALALITKATKAKPPKTETEFKALQKQIVKQVAAAISDTEKIAFGSYIQPSVWDKINNGGKWKGM